MDKIENMYGEYYNDMVSIAIGKSASDISIKFKLDSHTIETVNLENILCMDSFYNILIKPLQILGGDELEKNGCHIIHTYQDLEELYYLYNHISQTVLLKNSVKPIAVLLHTLKLYTDSHNHTINIRNLITIMEYECIKELGTAICKYADYKTCTLFTDYNVVLTALIIPNSGIEFAKYKSGYLSSYSSIYFDNKYNDIIKRFINPIWIDFHKTNNEFTVIDDIEMLWEYIGRIYEAITNKSDNDSYHTAIFKISNSKYKFAAAILDRAMKDEINKDILSSYNEINKDVASLYNKTNNKFIHITTVKQINGEMQQLDESIYVISYYKDDENNSKVFVNAKGKFVDSITDAKFYKSIEECKDFLNIQKMKAEIYSKLITMPEYFYRRVFIYNYVCECDKDNNLLIEIIKSMLSKDYSYKIKSNLFDFID